MKRRILIIDDEIKLTRSIAFALRQSGYDCLESHNGRAGYELAQKETPDLVLLDVRMPGHSGLAVLESLRQDLPTVPVIMMSALDATQDAVKAVKLGAVDYLSKPVDMDDLIQLIETTTAETQDSPEIQTLEEGRPYEASLLGNSALMRDLRNHIERATTSGVRTVLLRGELGVGRAMVARDLHKRACGAAAPFVEINCATLVGDQIETEIFGSHGDLHRRGLIEVADGGTLFLHEVEALSPVAQARIMAFLESGVLRQFGGRVVRPDVRIVAAANADLAQCAAAGQFRKDLHLRLELLPLDVPPLRDRREDIELLWMSFARSYARKMGCKQIRLSAAARDQLMSYDWPGNVRELKNLVERLTILKPGALIDVADLPREMFSEDLIPDANIEEQMATLERALVRDALTKARGRKGVAADTLGISRHALKRKMQRLGLT
ncbi:response regulator [Epibacterium sp. SM1979]|uniref:Response regulator n=1 Tax=Tritonibacter litoralis TaxID=2662264 RepID=A0A843YBQ1_9RHOB|nr:sigma-54 dependent transcriptional regulator [Tritonibacter litoralis]MQQ07095.1 response regulator [Tritonibacter litoralis]